MSKRKKTNATDAALASAVEAIADTDAHLAGSRPRNWLLIVESEWDEGRTFSSFQSDGQTPWEALGLLHFAALQEEQRALQAAHDAH